jgi:hypothetical protein
MAQPIKRLLHRLLHRLHPDTLRAHLGAPQLRANENAVRQLRDAVSATATATVTAGGSELRLYHIPRGAPET